MNEVLGCVIAVTAIAIIAVINFVARQRARDGNWHMTEVWFAQKRRTGIDCPSNQIHFMRRFRSDGTWEYRRPSDCEKDDEANKAAW